MGRVLLFRTRAEKEALRLARIAELDKLLTTYHDVLYPIVLGVDPGQCGATDAGVVEV